VYLRGMCFVCIPLHSMWRLYGTLRTEWLGYFVVMLTYFNAMTVVSIPWFSLRPHDTDFNSMPLLSIPCLSFQFHASPFNSMPLLSIPCLSFQFHDSPFNSTPLLSILNVRGEHLIFLRHCCRIRLWKLSKATSTLNVGGIVSEIFTCVFRMQ
jgi:hypothetical protein